MTTEEPLRPVQRGRIAAIGRHFIVQSLGPSGSYVVVPRSIMMLTARLGEMAEITISGGKGTIKALREPEHHLEHAHAR